MMRLLPVILLAFLLNACGVNDPSSKPATIEDVTLGAKHLPGFVNLYWHDEKGKLYLEINNLDEPFIYVNSLSNGVGSNDIGLDRGQLGDTRLARFVRSGSKVMLIADNPKYVANSNNPDERTAVDEAFARSILWGFEMVAAERGRILVDGTDFFLRDAHGIATRLKRADEGTYKVEASRSAVFMPRTRSFPDNTEVDAMVTLVGEPTGTILETVAPDPGIITVHQHHSFVRLPPLGYEPLVYDPRAGYIDQMVYDYATPVGDSLKTAYAWRHRLEKKNPGADVSEPLEPIVYYVDRGAPEPVRSALMEGAAWWNTAFEAAGYKDAFRVELLPEDADSLDVRYNVIQWVHRSTRGWSYGSSIRDPRTQEIIKGHVSLGSLRVRQDYLLAEGLLAPYVDDDVNENADAEVAAELMAFALARIRQLAAHEVGHTIGLEHNFAASADGRSSVMDYPYPYVTLDNNGKVDLSEAYGVGIGEWDKRAILWGYQDFPDDVDADRERQRILLETREAGLNFIADSHSRGDRFAVTAGPAHPLGSLWDNGADPVIELNRLMELRAHVLSRFSAHNIRVGVPMAKIEDALVPMYLMHRFQLQAAATVIGGQEFTYTLRGDGQQPTGMVPRQKQIEAIDAILETLSPAALRLRPELVALIPPRPPGSGDSREIFPRQTGYVFDPHAAAGTAAGLGLDMLLNPTRAARMNNNHTRDKQQPDFYYLLRQILEASWYRPDADDTDAPLERVVNIAVLERLMMLAGNGEAQAQVRAEAFDQLVELEIWLGAASTGVPADWRAHYRFAAEQIRRFRENPEAMAPLMPEQVPPGSPI